MENLHVFQAVPVVTGGRFQASSGDLKTGVAEGVPTNPSPDQAKSQEHLFPIVGRSIEDVRTADIQPIKDFPDYVNPTSAERPILVRTTKGIYCLDGSDKVAAAAAKGGSSAVVSCAVDTLAEHDDDDLVVRKATIRSATPGGKAEYMELSRNAVYLFNRHRSSNPNLKINSHGGRRKGPEFTSNRLDNAYKFLSDLLCKSETTIEGYVDHARYLTDEAIRFFIEHKAKKEYFDKMRVEKRKLVARLVEEKRPKEEIAAAVSSMMIARFSETLNKTKKTKGGHQAEKSGVRSAKEKGQDVPDAKSESPAPEDHRTGSTNGNNTASGLEPCPGMLAQTIDDNDMEEGVIRDEDPDSLFTVEDIKNAARGIAMRLNFHMGVDLTPEQLKSCFEREIANLADLLRKTESLLATR